MIRFGSILSGMSVKERLHFRRLSDKLSPIQIFSNLRSRYEDLYLLESVTGPQRLAEYSFIGFDPIAEVLVKDGIYHIKEGSGEAGDPLDPLSSYLHSRILDRQDFRLIGGAVGYISYDAVRYWEKIPRIQIDDQGHPDLQFGIYSDGIVFDHKSGEAFYYTNGYNRFDEVREAIEEPSEEGDFSYSEPESTVSKERFEDKILRAKDLISSGDILQVVLSRRIDFRVKGDLMKFYTALRRINPSPYMYFLKFGGREIIGSSPEMLVRVEGRKVETYPIAGTRPRVDDESENHLLAKALLADPKDCAEHLMLVDLARNDLGRISRYGSVNVPELMKVHEFSHVQHIVSRVVGELREGYDAFDAFQAVFPAGTVSGAPKVRAMEIIEELEPYRRGIYAGALGYFSYNGNADFAIIIRTLVSDDGRAGIQVGAGIVADSDPEHEWFETEHKAAALLKALRSAEEDMN